MPELPEVETIRVHLKPKIIGKKIKSVAVLSKKQFVGDKKNILNQKIIGIERTGKVLSFKLTNGFFINVHLKLTGELLFASDLNEAVFSEVIPFTKTKRMPANTTRTIIAFSDGSGLFFNDLRKFGWMKVSHKKEIPKSVDVLSKDFTLDYFRQTINSTKKPIKQSLMDQEKMAGIGNIYANDALFLAKIHPTQKANQLTEKNINNLYQAIKKVIGDGIKHQGSSGADEAFVLPDGRKGQHQRYFLVYQREGEPCSVCKTSIKRIKQGGRSSFYCPRCQKE